MPQLSGIPNELLRHIVGYVMPEDLESFAQASKHIRSVSTSTLKHHHQLIRKYGSFSGRATAKTVEPLLRDVLANPRTGHYVKKMELCGFLAEDFGD